MRCKHCDTKLFKYSITSHMLKLHEIDKEELSQWFSIKDGFKLRNAKNRGLLMYECDFMLPRVLQAYAGAIAVVVCIVPKSTMICEPTCLREPLEPGGSDFQRGAIFWLVSSHCTAML